MAVDSGVADIVLRSPSQVSSAGTSDRLELPKEVGQRTELLDQLQGPFRVVDGRFDLSAMTDDADILQQAIHVPSRKGNHGPRC